MQYSYAERNREVLRQKTTVEALQPPNAFTNPKGTFLHPSKGDNQNQLQIEGGKKKIFQ